MGLSYTQPLLLLFGLIALCGLVLRRRAVTAAGVCALLLVSWPPVAWLLDRPLEVWYPVRPVPAGSAEAIVVPLSSIRMPSRERPYPLPDEATTERVEYAVWLYRHWKPLPLLICGGPERAGRTAFSTVIRSALVERGIPEGIIWTEERSHSTHEDAVYGAEILRQHGIRAIALVVEAQSMLRAEGSFRKQGLDVSPAPTAFREWGPLSEELLPNWKAIRRNEITLHEALGWLWYRMRGWI